MFDIMPKRPSFDLNEAMTTILLHCHLHYVFLINLENRQRLVTCKPMISKQRVLIPRFQCLRELHDNGIIHRDIKPDNILISKNSFDIKLIDFGCATFSRLADQNVAGTLDFFPPECFTFNEFDSEKMLVWSMGALLYFLLCGEFEVNMGQHRRNFRREIKLTNASREMLDRLLCYFPTKRISLDGLYKSSWLNDNPSI